MLTDNLKKKNLLKFFLQQRN